MLGWLLAVSLSGSAAGAAKSASKQGISIEGLDPGEIVRRLKAAYEAGHPKEFDGLGLALAAAASKARPVLEALAQSDSIHSATLQAELLLWMARGNDTRNGARQDEMPTEELGRRAAAWLDHPDPFIRGTAEWALATRLYAEYENAEERVGGRRMAKPWPDQEAPAWYQRWLAIETKDLLEYDYVRQAVALGSHRTAQALLQSGELILKRAEALLAYAAKRGAKANGDGAHEAFSSLREAVQNSPADLTLHRQRWLALRRAAREVALANPDLNFQQIVFGLRQADRAGGNITVGRWNTHAPGGDIYIKTGFSPQNAPQPLLKGRLGPGHLRGLELNWEADKLVFAYARQPGRALGGAVKLRPNHDIGGYFGQGVGEVEEMSHLFEVRVDGSGLRQLTEAPYHADQEPTYLPNGDIVFVSDRSNFGSQCAGALEQDNMILNFYRCDPDGKNIRALSHNKDFDRHPHVMDNGQLLFLHWEYQERHLWQTHTLWTCRPDGSMTDALYKQHIESGPMSLREARQVRGTSQLAAIACGHHNYDQGAVFLADYALGINAREAMRNVTPGVSGTEGGYGGIKAVAEGGVQDGGGHYMFPYPLSEKSFLVSYSYKRPERNSGQNFSLYYIDVWGHKELIHRDRKMSVAFLSPLRPVPRPLVLPELPEVPEGHPRWAVVSMANARAHWPGAETGQVKYLRISQKVPWPCVRDESKACGFNDLHWMPSAWEPVLGLCDWGAARVIGIVPVEADGSAYFKVPADQPVYFHALDENFLELRRMRSNVTLKAGENRSCIGCHESRAVTTPPGQVGTPLALRRDPSVPVPPPWGDRLVPDFEKHIAPVFEAHCARCHGAQNPEGGLEFTSRRIDGYLQSYRTLFGLKASDPTPALKGWWSIWRPNQTPPGDVEFAGAKTFLQNIFKKPPPSQLVTLANYTGGAEVSLPRQFGSANSKLTLTLLDDPLHRREVKMSPDDWISLVTWVDLNAQYWGTFVDKDRHYASKRARLDGGPIVPPRRVTVIFPDPWLRPPAGEWIWQDEDTVILRP